ncbi:MAG: hypothetical protein HY919_06140, partial [Elusimicrobia bacterium]|nr:hypothetical protein [Elusimicrobiota bacterium]
MKLSELLLCSTKKAMIRLYDDMMIRKKLITLSPYHLITVVVSLLITLSPYHLITCLSSEEETTISLDDETQQRVQKIAQTKETKKKINSLYKSAERYRKKKKLLFAVEKYKEVLEKDSYHKKSRERLSDMYTEIKYKVDEKILYKSEEVYYAQSVLYFINNDLTAA